MAIDPNLTVNVGFSIGFVSLLGVAFYLGRIDNRIANIERNVPAYDEMANRLIMVSTQLDGLINEFKEFRDNIREELKEFRHELRNKKGHL